MSNIWNDMLILQSWQNWSTRVEVPKYPVKAGVYSFALHIFFVNACMHLLHFEGKMLSAVPRLKYYVNIESIRRPWARLWLVVGTKKTKKKKNKSPTPGNTSLTSLFKPSNKRVGKECAAWRPCPSPVSVEWSLLHHHIHQ